MTVGTFPRKRHGRKSCDDRRQRLSPSVTGTSPGRSLPSNTQRNAPPRPGVAGMSFPSLRAMTDRWVSRRAPVDDRHAVELPVVDEDRFRLQVAAHTRAPRRELVERPVAHVAEGEAADPPGDRTLLAVLGRVGADAPRLSALGIPGLGVQHRRPRLARLIAGAGEGRVGQRVTGRDQLGGTGGGHATEHQRDDDREAAPGPAAPARQARGSLGVVAARSLQQLLAELLPCRPWRIHAVSPIRSPDAGSGIASASVRKPRETRARAVGSDTSSAAATSA